MTTAAVDPSTDPSTTSADLVVIGGGPAGHSAAAGYRDAGGAGRVVIISADHAAPYQRPPLSKDYLRGESGVDALPLEPPQFYRDNEIELWLGEPVEHLNLDHRVVRTAAGRVVSYGSCVLATGCRPTRLPVPGADHPGVLLLRFLDEGRLLRVAAERSASAIVIGSGFIGCEAAVSLARRGREVTVLSTEELPQITRLGRPVAERIAGWLTDAGVEFRGKADVVEIRGGRTVDVRDGGAFTADLVLSASGVLPESTVARQAGLELADDRILVDDRMATDRPGLFAAGDVVLARNAAAGRRLRVEHWGEALRMGEIAGRNAAGGDESWTEVPGFWSQIGDHTMKYAAWGDGFDSDHFVEHSDGGFTVWYAIQGRAVGVLTVNADADDERGRLLIARGAPAPLPAQGSTAVR